MMTSNPRRALDRWAHDFAGYADFDTYVRAGGGVIDARRDIGRRIESLTGALQALRDYPSPAASENPESRAPSPTASENPPACATIGPEALARLEAEQHEEPPDPGNAHVQGANDAV